MVVLSLSVLSRSWIGEIKMRMRGSELEPIAAVSVAGMGQGE